MNDFREQLFHEAGLEHPDAQSPTILELRRSILRHENRRRRLWKAVTAGCIFASLCLGLATFLDQTCVVRPVRYNYFMGVYDPASPWVICYTWLLRIGYAYLAIAFALASCLLWNRVRLACREVKNRSLRKRLRREAEFEYDEGQSASGERLRQTMVQRKNRHRRLWKMVTAGGICTLLCFGLAIFLRQTSVVFPEHQLMGYHDADGILSRSYRWLLRLGYVSLSVTLTLAAYLLRNRIHFAIFKRKQ